MATKRGRPPAKPNKKKGHSLEVRLEPEDKELFKEAAERAGLPLSAWVRNRLRASASDELHTGGPAARPAQQATIHTFAPESFEVLKPIPVVIESTDDGFIARYYDANASMIGDTQEEAFNNLKEFLLDLFETLGEDEDSLGPHLKRQLAVLRDVIRKTR